MSKYCKVKHIDHGVKTRLYADEKLKGKKLSKGEFAVGEEVRGDDELILGTLGIAISREDYNDISKRKGTLKTIK